MPSPDEVEKAVSGYLRQSRGYSTINHLAHVTGVAPQAILKFVINHPEAVRKSHIETDDGQSLFMLNTAWSGIADAWAAFRYINAKKY